MKEILNIVIISNVMGQKEADFVLNSAKGLKPQSQQLPVGIKEYNPNLARHSEALKRITKGECYVNNLHFEV